MHGRTARVGLRRPDSSCSPISREGEVVNPSSKMIVSMVETKLLSPGPKAQASEAYVLNYNDGRLKVFPGAPATSERWGSKYCYVVDMSDQRFRDTFAIPALGDAYSFRIEAEATWRVASPKAVVKAGLTDGNA